MATGGKYIALLRGINVSGQKIIKMADLRAIMIKNNFYKVQTYIQSGNIVFNYAESDPELIKNIIHQLIKDAYGYDVVVHILTKEAYIRCVEACPFPDFDDFKKLNLCFLQDIPEADAVLELKKFGANEKWFLIENRLYIIYNEGMARSKFTNNFIEKKLGTMATTRNWNTVLKIKDLLQDEHYS